MYLVKISLAIVVRAFSACVRVLSFCCRFACPSYNRRRKRKKIYILFLCPNLSSLRPIADFPIEFICFVGDPKVRDKQWKCKIIYGNLWRSEPRWVANRLFVIRTELRERTVDNKYYATNALTSIDGSSLRCDEMPIILFTICFQFRTRVQWRSIT